MQFPSNITNVTRRSLNRPAAGARCHSAKIQGELADPTKAPSGRRGTSLSVVGALSSRVSSCKLMQRCNLRRTGGRLVAYSSTEGQKTDVKVEEDATEEVDCIGGGMTVECTIPEAKQKKMEAAGSEVAVDVPIIVEEVSSDDAVSKILGSLVLVSPFFLWGTSMVAMKQVLPATGPFFVASVRLIPAGLAVVMYALATGRKNPDTSMAWLAVALFAVVDGACFQGFLAEGLQLTSAGLGSVIIDSQPITVAILASLLYGERMGPTGAVGLLVGVLG
eukprot:CAMPEP_0118940960 /NCGR_PEP_ID=MMETSP1169-20130426/32761_1 /TAXON_ID=36882 /ORGANISM="Pyramimonas obovata, Strain CCMP722" /LENGTH=276 /DNA_ID=CAMNT_0006885603 /DNA_START=131 /DNA_END=957 /DNA_ORIENTATION=-